MKIFKMYDKNGDHISRRGDSCDYDNLQDAVEDALFHCEYEDYDVNDSVIIKNNLNEISCIVKKGISIYLK